MDNLTHSLAGAVLGQMGLKTKTGLAMPTLIIAANLPDIDAVATLLGGHQHLAIRRGITHGPIAMLLLPVLLWAIMLAWDKWRPSEKRLPVHKGWLLALAYVGTISHPALDWLNVYGVRLLEPFSSQWFYGDTLFIIDVWIWAALAIGVWLSLRRERRGAGNWQRPAWVSFTAVCAYIFVNGGITGVAEARAAGLIKDATGLKPTMVVASPIPIKFWEREVLWRHKDKQSDAACMGSGDFVPSRGVRLTYTQNTIGGLPNRYIATEANRKFVPDVKSFPCSDRIDAKRIRGLSATDEDLKAYLFWSRMPIIGQEGIDLDYANLVVQDQRFMDPRVGERFTVKIKVKR